MSKAVYLLLEEKGKKWNVQNIDYKMEIRWEDKMKERKKYKRKRKYDVSLNLEAPEKVAMIKFQNLENSFFFLPLVIGIETGKSF